MRYMNKQANVRECIITRYWREGGIKESRYTVGLKPPRIEFIISNSSSSI